jgi:RNA polymerase sigma-70 factor (ECF subfamily)
VEQTDIVSESALTANRAWLVRLCTRLSGNPDVAEDLAQETLIEAWRSADRLHSPDLWQPWLAGIARNVARRWRRSEALYSGNAPAIEMEQLPSGDDADPEILYLEQELSAMLAAGLAAMPVASREALIAYGLERRAQADIAADLGIGEAAVSARVYRGKRALRAALEAPDLRDAIAAFGFGDGDAEESAGADPWRETAIRCPLCGTHTLRFQFDASTNMISVRCAGNCLPDHAGCIIGGITRLPDTEHLSSPKAILTRHLIHAHAHYRSLLAEDECTCPFCGEKIPVRIGSPASAFTAGVVLSCPRCGCFDDTSLWHLTLDHPAAQRFWRRHPRMHALPITGVEHEGIPALVTGFESRDASARIEVLYSPARYEILHIDSAAG